MSPRKTEVTENDLRRMVAEIVEEEGSQARAGKRLGVQQSFIHAVLYSGKAIGVQIPYALGYERVIMYRKREGT